MMIISNNNRRAVGRPSLRTLTVRRTSQNHATIIFARKAGQDLQMQSGNKVSIVKVKNTFYICPNSKTGCSLKVARNGQGLESYRISCLEFVNMLLNGFNAEKLAVLMIGAITKDIEGQTYYQICKKAIRSDKY